MNHIRRRILVGVLAISLSSAAAGALNAAPRANRDKELRDPVERIIRVIRRLFTISILDDMPAPPKP